jgi:hypothetical protein
MAKNRSVLPAKLEYTAPFEKPASRAMSSRDVAAKPCARNRRSAASSTSWRVRAWRSALVGAVAVVALATSPAFQIP